MVMSDDTRPAHSSPALRASPPLLGSFQPERPDDAGLAEKILVPKRAGERAGSYSG